MVIGKYEKCKISVEKGWNWNWFALNLTRISNCPIVVSWIIYLLSLSHVIFSVKKYIINLCLNFQKKNQIKNHTFFIQKMIHTPNCCFLLYSSSCTAAIYWKTLATISGRAIS